MKTFNQFLSEAVVPEVVTASSVIKDVIFMSLCAINVTHVLHWTTKSDANHRALGEFYDGLTGLVDVLAETAISTGVKLSPVDMVYSDVKDITIVNKLREVVGVAIDEVAVANSQSVVDALIQIQKQIDTLNYKLENLK